MNDQKARAQRWVIRGDGRSEYTERNMRQRTKAWLEFGAFCAVFGALFDIHQHYHALDHWMALIWLVFLVTGGVYA